MLRRVAAAGAVLCLTAACSGTEETRDRPTGPQRVVATAPHPTTQVSTARRMAAQYDYAGATRLLHGDSSAAARQTREEISRAESRSVPWADTTQVPHLFYHSLIVDPGRAFAPHQEQRVGYAQFMVTAHEFRAQLRQLHQRGYVLIHPQRLVAKDARGVMRPVPLRLPPGKKPFVLSIDDVSYYTYMKGAGFATNLTLKDGKVVNTYTDAAGRTTYGAYDVSTVVDEFVRSHPDFSYRGDKGTMALTGYDGVLGYRTSVSQHGNTPQTRAEQGRAKSVAAALKQSGWRFASHSWGHINMTTSSLASIQADHQRWAQEVQPILGPTDMLIYPFGADISRMPPYSAQNPKFAYLHNTAKFDYFFPIDTSVASWSQTTPDSWRQARINIDGITMQRVLDGRHSVLNQFFDTRSTLDPKRPLPLPQPPG